MSSQDRTADTVRRASDLLEAEYEQSKVSRLQRVLFALLQLFAYLLPTLIAALWVMGPQPSVPRFYVQNAVTICLALVVVLAVANLPLIRTAIRQVRLSHRLRALRLAEHLWVPGARVRRRHARAVLILTTPIALLVLFVINVASGSVEAGLLPVAAVLFACAGLPVGLFSLASLLDWTQGRLNYAREVVAVRRTLERVTSGGPSFTGITRELALRIAEIERLHILRGRARALELDEDSGEEGLFTSKRPQVVEALRGLPLETRLRVEEAVDELGDVPTPATATELDHGLWSLDVARTDVRIVYSVDREAGCIEIMSVESVEGETTPR